MEKKSCNWLKGAATVLTETVKTDWIYVCEYMPRERKKKNGVYLDVSVGGIRKLTLRSSRQDS